MSPTAGLRISMTLPLVALLALGGCMSTVTTGEGGSIVTGSASETQIAAKTQGGAGSASKGKARQLQKCGTPIATVALAEDEDSRQIYVAQLSQLNLPSSPMPLLRLMFQQSNCFRIVDRGRGLKAISREQELAKQGLLKQGSGITGGQLIAADYTITPNIAFSEGNAGGAGVAAMVGSLLGSVLPGAGLIAGGVRVSKKEAQVVLFLTDNRTGVQVMAAEGSAKSSDIGFGAGGFGLSGLGGGAWGNTNQGKVVSAAFLDATNKIIDAIRTYAR